MTRQCVWCQEVKAVEDFPYRGQGRVRRDECRPCWKAAVKKMGGRRKLQFPPIPPHLEDRLWRVGKRLMIPAEAVRAILQSIDPEATQTQIARLVGLDEVAIRRLMDQEWVAEEKVDRLLTALHCSHLWYEPPLKQYHDAILEYEALYTSPVQLELVAA